MTLRALSIVILLVLLRNTAPTAAKDSYELRGKVLQIDGNPFHGVVPVVFLQGATAPFSTRTVADRAGHFTFKGLAPETYTLIVTVPRAGEQSQTVEVGPSFADSKRRVELTVLFERKPAPEGAHGVSVSQLAIPELATQEYERALGRLQNRDVP